MTGGVFRVEYLTELSFLQTMNIQDIWIQQQLAFYNYIYACGGAPGRPKRV